MNGNNIKIKKEVLNNEILFVLYFWGFILVKPIILQYQNISSLILLIYAGGLFVISFIKNFNQGIKMKVLLVIILPIYFLILIDYLFRPNEYSFMYMYEFTIYGVLPTYFLSQVKDIRKLLSIYSYISAIMFIIYGLDPLNDFKYLSDYMTFGFQFILPAYIGINIGRTFFNRKWWGILEILCLIDLIIFANRSCILSVILYLVIKEVLFGKINAKKIFKYGLICLSGTIVVINLSEILAYINNILAQRGYFSYSLVKYQQFLAGMDFAQLTSGRLDIWSNSISMIKENILIGQGSGAFMSNYGVYTHNIILDLLLQYGIIVFLIFSSVIFLGIKNLLKIKQYEIRLLGVMLFCLWCPKLFFSIYLFKDIGIWCFILYGIKCKEYKFVRVGERHEY